MVLLDVAFDAVRREATRRELAQLQAAGTIALGRDDRWRALRRPITTSSNVAPMPGWSTSGADEERLIAVPAAFLKVPIPGDDPDTAEDADVPDPLALLRYYRSALQSDPRGALTQSDHRHGEVFQLVAGEGDLFPAEDEEVILRIRSEHLPGAFREALIRREGEENGLAVGWPLAVGRQSGATAIRPVGLIAGLWRRTEDAIEVLIEANDVLVNPDWVQATARLTAWSRPALEDLFRGPGGSGLPGGEFLARLREAVAGSVRGRLNGRRFAAELDPGDHGIHEALALFLPSGTTFTAGAVRDLDAIAAWPLDRLERTALAPLLGLKHVGEIPSAPPINTGPLNLEQIEAARRAMRAPLSVVAGPPGTGKSQAIVAMAASALWCGQKVIVASRNHQALDAVEERLAAIAPDAPFIVRTLDPARDIDRSMAAAIGDLVAGPGGAAKHGPEPEVAAELDRRAAARAAALDRIAERRAFRLQLAEDVERLEARRLARLAGSEDVLPIPVVTPGLWTRLLRWLGITRRRDNDGATEQAAAISTPALRRRIENARACVAELGPEDDPVALTEEIAALAAKTVGVRITAQSIPEEARRLALANAQADLELEGGRRLAREIADLVLHHRPLWLTSVLGTPNRVPLHDGLFDLAIFDEASQCDIASALPILARARRGVIVGDDRQLSFIPQLGIAQDRNLMAAQRLPKKGMGRFAQGRRSLFDLALSTPDVPAGMLRDQYRSAADIVGYINREFYGGKLRVAADQAALRVPAAGRPGIAWTDVPARGVDGGGRDNINRAEVEAIVAHIAELLLERGYDGSVGVISPFRPQVHALGEQIASRIPESHRSAADLRVGTVDSFQGQERDLILFSPVLHARAAPSAVAFLQKDWRRLNVAVSRARAVAHVFGDLTYARSGAVRRLQSLAARATEPRRAPADGVFDSTWERQLFDALRARGLDPRPQYEIAGRRLDFALFGTGGMRLDVEVDGRRWHQDIDGNRKLDDHWRDHQLRSLGWTVRRFWVDELDKDMEGCVDLIERDLA